MATALRLTLAEYDSLIQVGAFDRLERKIELIRGELIEKSPAGPIHDDLITYLTNWSVRRADPVQTLLTSQTGMDWPETQSQCIHLHRQPSQGDYQHRSVHSLGESLQPMVQPNAKLDLRDLFVG